MTKLRLTAAAFSLFASQSCASVDKVIVAQPDVAFSLPVGKTATVNGSPSRLTFTQVRADSRCPTSVVCVWAGDASIELSLSREGSGPETAVLSLSSPGNEARIGDFLVRFVSLAPYPATPEPNAPRRYVAELVIRRL